MLKSNQIKNLVEEDAKNIKGNLVDSILKKIADMDQVFITEYQKKL